jgi:hypothetical protein
MIKVYSLRHMFQALPEGETVPIMMTRDNEHLLEKLSDDVKAEAIGKGWITVTDVPTLDDVKRSAKAAKAEQKEAVKAAKEGGKRT